MLLGSNPIPSTKNNNMKKFLCYIGLHSWIHYTSSHDYHRTCTVCEKHQNRPSPWQKWKTTK